MATLKVWVWRTGQTADGAPILAKCPLDEVPGDGALAAEQDVDAWRDEIMAELNEVDRKSIRALREGNAALIASHEARAQTLRRHLRLLDA